LLFKSKKMQLVLVATMPIMALICLAIGFNLISDLSKAAAAPEAYRFGTDAMVGIGGASYQSLEHYVVAGSWMIFASAWGSGICCAVAFSALRNVIAATKTVR